MTVESTPLRRMVPADDEGARLDVAIGRRFPRISRRVAKTLALEGRVHLDGQPAPPSTRVREGQMIAICVTVDRSTLPDATILAVTDGFVYAHKPAGIHVHRLRPDDPVALADFVAHDHPECGDASDDPREGGAVHRLDGATSGVVAFARTAAAWAEGRAAFSSGGVVKRYLARCPLARDDQPPPPWPPTLPDGAFEAWLTPLGGSESSPEGNTPTEVAWRVRAPLGPGRERRSVAVRLDGQRAASVVRRLDDVDGVRIFEIDLETGRRHQIRAHLAWLHHPIEGDVLYGAPSYARLGLHAWSLHLRTITGEAPVVAPPPECFRAVTGSIPR